MLLSLVPLLTQPALAAAAVVPTGFQDTLVASGLAQPTTLAFAPDGRLFVAEKASGRIRVVKDGVLLATPFFDATQVIQAPAYFDSYNERGMLGIAFDPAFATNRLVYLYHSICKVPGSGTCSTARNRVVRVRAGYQGNDDRADPASYLVVLDDIPSDAGNHNAGWIGFGPLDGKLYVAVGDGGAVPARAQDVGSLSGKILRLEASGTAPFDNPFVGLWGARPEVWAYGLRNPWRCRFHPDGRLFCGDVGQAAWEEVNWIVPAGNYGWPVTEGDFNPATYPQFIRPIHAYAHNAQGGSSITGGDFGSQTSFPGDYKQSYFFADYSYQWLRRALLAADGVTVLSVSSFGTALGGVTDLVAGPDGGLYYNDLLAGTVRRILPTGSNRPPVARATATPSQGPPPLTVQFSSAGSADADGDPLTLSWNFGDGSPPSSAANPVHVYTAPGSYTARLTVSDGRSPAPGTDTVALPITVGNPPVVSITQPAAGLLFQGGQTIALAGAAVDAEDGPLPAAALRWEIRFHHDDHWHPYINELAGSPRSFVTATSGETAATVSYRIILRATDSSGLTGETSLYILPRVVTLRLETNPPGLQLTLDGQPVATPTAFESVVGVLRTIGAPSPQGANVFTGWSDGGVQVHTISTPATNTTYTASFSGPGQTTTTTTVVTTSTAAPPTTTTTTPPPSGTNLMSTATPIAFVTNPGGGGNRDLNVIRDGIKPPVNHWDSLAQYDTFTDGTPRASDWFGGTWPAPQTFGRVVFQEGREFIGGGCFATLTVQVRQGGAWVAVPGVTWSPAYAGCNGVGFETFTATFPAIGGDGVRVWGTLRATESFTSCGELEVYAAGAATTTTSSTTTTTAPPTTTSSTTTSTAPPTTTSTSTTTTSTAAPPTTTTTTPPPSGTNLMSTATPIAFVTNPGGGGNRDLNVIRDGIKPPVNHWDSLAQYDTFTDGTPRASDWFGGTWPAPQTFGRVVFQEGREFTGGGCFATLTVQVRQGGAWVAVPGVTWSPAYAGCNGVGFETFTATFPAIGGDGVRVWGTLRATESFTSCGELEVYAAGAATTTTSSTTTTTAPPTTTSSTTNTTSPTTSTTSTSTTTTSTSSTAPPTTTTSTSSTTSTTVASGTRWFGTRTVGSQITNNTSDNKRMSPFALGEPGRVTRLVMHLASPEGGSQRHRPVIYADAAGAPGALVAAGPERLVAAAPGGEWIGLPFDAPVPLAPGVYWIGSISGATSGATKHFIGSTSRARIFAFDLYADGPSNPAGEVAFSVGPISIYAEYTP